MEVCGVHDSPHEVLAHWNERRVNLEPSGSHRALPAEVLQPNQGRGESWLLGQDRPPLRLGFRQPSLLHVDHGQVMPSLVALEAGVQTAEMRPFPPAYEL